MPSNEKNSKSNDTIAQQIATNATVLGIFIGAVVGFIIAMWFGILNIGEKAKFTDWLGAIASVSAVGVSGLAVWYVKRTLDVTRDMANEQTRVSFEQLRAWVLVDDIPVKAGHKSANNIMMVGMAIVNLRNFGNSPAANVVISVAIRELHSFKAIPQPDFGYKNFKISVLPHGGVQSCEVIIDNLRLSSVNSIKLLVTIRYDTMGRTIEPETFVYTLSEDKDGTLAFHSNYILTDA